ncbi:hypothetical protein OG322_40700 [Streptomyces sp. NBC_01260]|uniref:hypothetical protein n=1 Tax=Streptomyces sp. NBC_01260 TaxID=2903801 RepID=UPI002E31FD95|nr:hypothetical protein [Streptomyces sp. NBC_01260]
MKRMMVWAMPGAPARHSPSQELQQKPSERRRQEGMRAGLPVVVVHGGDRDEDARGDVQEHLEHLRAHAVDDRAGGIDVAGLQRLDVGEGADDTLRLHRGERRGDGVLGHDDSSRTGRPADRGGLKRSLYLRPCGQSPAAEEGDLSPAG